MNGISGISGNAQDIRSNYLTLLVTQLQNQNPLEPMNNHDMTSQLAQISQLEQLESIDNKFERMLLVARLNEAMDMVGKQITFFPTGEQTAVTATVENVDIVDGKVLLRAGGYRVGLDQVQSVSG